VVTILLKEQLWKGSVLPARFKNR